MQSFSRPFRKVNFWDFRRSMADILLFVELMRMAEIGAGDRLLGTWAKEKWKAMFKLYTDSPSGEIANVQWVWDVWWNICLSHPWCFLKRHCVCLLPLSITFESYLLLISLELKVLENKLYYTERLSFHPGWKKLWVNLRIKKRDFNF